MLLGPLVLYTQPPAGRRPRKAIAMNHAQNGLEALERTIDKLSEVRGLLMTATVGSDFETVATAARAAGADFDTALRELDKATAQQLPVEQATDADPAPPAA